MYVRLTSLTVKPGKLNEFKKFYNETAFPTVKKQKGSIDCRLLEPVDGKEEYFSMTTWETKADADAYHTKGVYKELVDKARTFSDKDPVLRVFQTEDVLIHA